MTHRIKILAFVVFVLAILLLTAAFVLRLEETRRLTGVVRDAETRAPLAGVELAAGTVHIRTGEKGEYAIAFPRGKLALRVELDGYLPVQVEVDGSDLFTQVLTADLELVPNRVAGYVLDRDTNQTLPNVPLQIGGQSVLANAQGAFEARAVKSGTPISVEVVGYQPAVLQFNGEDFFNIPLVPSVITITVADLGGRPIANAKVEVGEQSAASDPQGRVVLRRVKPGVTVRASAPGYESASAGLNGNELRLQLRATRLEGTVTDAATGRPIGNVRVYSGSTLLTTNAAGAYRLDNVPARATLTFQAPGYRKTQVDVSGLGRRDVKLQPFLVKGIHIPFGALPDHVRENMELVKKTELNAIVIDVKSEKGRVGWDSEVPLAKQIGAPYLKGIDLLEVVERCRVDDIYCIARIPVFQDTLLANTRPDLALRFPNGRVYSDNNESAWTNANNPAVWDYNIALAKEVAALGFDEIQFDYIRFPGQVAGLYAGALATDEGRIAAISGFLARAQKELRPLGVFISADVFGLTTATDGEEYTGQRLQEIGSYVDYVSPMVYPDVWSRASYLLSNGLGIANCGEAVKCPYDVIYQSYKRAAEKSPAKVRLWLQAYAGRGNYGVAQYRVQKKAAEEAGSVGWMFWSGVGNYDAQIFNAR